MKDIFKILDTLQSAIEGHSYDWLENNGYFISNGNDNGFESLVDKELTEMSKKSNPIKFTYTGNFGHHFPDIDIEIQGIKYGIELKSRQDGTFNTLGNSIFESISSKDYADILIFFGSRNKKRNTKYTCKFDKYRKSLSGVHVTHSPRFKISLDNNVSVFKDDAEYTKFRDENEDEKSSWVRKTLAKTANKNKWYVSQELKPEDWNSLDNSTKKSVLADLIINFPIDLFGKKAQYSKTSNFLTESYFVSSSNLRDLFSAGGKVEITTIPNVKFPHNLYIANSVKLQIQSYINNPDITYEKQCINNWKLQNKNITNLFKKNDSFEEKFKKVLNTMSDNYKNPNNISLFDLITGIDNEKFQTS